MGRRNGRVWQHLVDSQNDCRQLFFWGGGDEISFRVSRSVMCS